MISRSRKPRKPLLAKLNGVRCWKITLTQGKFAVVDYSDLRLVDRYWWCAVKHRNTYYALTTIRKSNGQWTSTRMHQLIGQAMGIAGAVDHKDGNGLDNRRKNLRPGPPKLNHANRGKPTVYAGKDTRSLYKGVTQRKNAMRFQA